MSREQLMPEATESLCPYETCRFCVHRANVSRTPNGEGQCEMELQGRATISMCKGKLFFSLAPDRAGKYRKWLLGRSDHSRETPDIDVPSTVWMGTLNP